MRRPVQPQGVILSRAESRPHGGRRFLGFLGLARNQAPRVLARRALWVLNGVGRVLRLWLNLHVFLYASEKAYARLPDRWKDGRALLLRRFHRRGELFFVQVGSNDGVRRDPIHRFVMRDRWSGIMIEPVPRIFSVLVAVCGSNPNLRFENVAIAERRGRLAFFSLRDQAGNLPEWHDQVGTLLPETLERYRERIPNFDDCLVEEEVEAITYSDLMDRHGEPAVDFLHIDAEGYDHRILHSIDFDRHAPHAILYENVIIGAEEQQACIDLLRRHGYRMIAQGSDTFAYRSTHYEGI